MPYLINKTDNRFELYWKLLKEKKDKMRAIKLEFASRLCKHCHKHFFKEDDGLASFCGVKCKEVYLKGLDEEDQVERSRWTRKDVSWTKSHLAEECKICKEVARYGSRKQKKSRKRGRKK